MARYAGRVVPARDELTIFHGHPTWRSMLTSHLRGFVLAVAAGALAGAATAAGNGRVRAGWVFLAVLAVFVIVIARSLLRRRRTTYTITTQRLIVELGLIARDVHETRLEQIQDVSWAQSPIERALGIGNVCFDTAGGGAFDYSFRGVADPRQIARAVDDALRRRSMARA